MIEDFVLFCRPSFVIKLLYLPVLPEFAYPQIHGPISADNWQRICLIYNNYLGLMLTIENAFYDVAAVNNDTINTSNN